MTRVLEVFNLLYTYPSVKNNIKILENLDFTLLEGEMVALLGPSGSGKTTFLNCVGLIDKPNSGIIKILDEKCDFLSDSHITNIRSKYIGFIFQNHRLFPEFSSLENVMLPQLLAGKTLLTAKENSIEILNFLGLHHRLNHRPAHLSGGEAQRVAIARAVANAPKIILADEPTGNLDKETSKLVFDLFYKVVKATNMSCIIATHNHTLAKKMNKIYTIENKQIKTLKESKLS